MQFKAVPCLTETTGSRSASICLPQGSSLSNWPIVVNSSKQLSIYLPALLQIWILTKEESWTFCSVNVRQPLLSTNLASESRITGNNEISASRNVKPDLLTESSVMWRRVCVCVCIVGFHWEQFMLLPEPAQQPPLVFCPVTLQPCSS